MSEKRGGVIPGGDNVRQALRWLADQRLADPKAPRMKLIEEAALRFDLAPVETDFLIEHWKEG